MTCLIAAADPIFEEEIRSLCTLAGVTVVSSGRADLLILDSEDDTPPSENGFAFVLRFSRDQEKKADFYRPFSYTAFLEELSLLTKEMESEKHTLAYTFPEQTAFTATEKRLLEVLLGANGKTVSVAELAFAVFGNAENANELKVYIRHLRQKIEEPQGVRVIETVRGEGYRLRKDRVGKTHIGFDKGQV